MKSPVSMMATKTGRDMWQLVLLFCFSAKNLVWSTTVNQTALSTELFQNYDSALRPICDLDLPVNVSIGLAIRQIIELNEPKQILTLNAWIRLRWTDCRLAWNETVHSLTSLNVPFSKVWVPDITLYDNTEGEMVGFKDFRPTISSDGTVSYNFPTVLSVLCKVDVTYFPFDTQSCSLKFGSWVYHGFQLDVTNRSATGDVSSFMDSSEWYKPDIPVARNVFVYGCCPEPYPDVTFTVSMRRKSLFYVLNLLYPCILITGVALLGFILPPDSGEKVSLEITVLLSLSVFMLVVSDSLPPTSETFPYIGMYFATSMMLITMSTILTVCILNLHFRGHQNHPVPAWVNRIFLGWMARMLCVSTPEHDMVITDRNKLCDVCPAETTTSQSEEVEQESGTPSSMTPMMHVLLEQLHVLRCIVERKDRKEKHEKLNAKWFTVAVVLDRFFLALFSFVTVISTMAIILPCI